MPDPNRRDALAAISALPLIGGTARASDIVRAENEKPGTTDWQLTYTRVDPATKWRSRMIEGYCSRQSVAAGDKLDVFVSTDPASPFHIDVYRMGYYQGRGGRLMGSFGPFKGKTQPTPPVGEQRLRECEWEPAVTITIPNDWPSGVYLGKLRATAHRYQSYVVFIVKDERKADVLFQCSDNTWQAYNAWPDNYSLYTNDRPDKKPLVSGVRVSCDRPYGKYVQIFDNPLSQGSGEFLLWEFPFAFWLEQHGYDVTYCSNVDVFRSVDTITRAKMFLSVGHDEYWDRKQYDHCMEAVKAGVNFGFFSGNSVCFVTPFAPSSKGVPDRILTRAGRYGGIRPKEHPWMADLTVAAPNEATLMGAQTITPFNRSGDWTCAKPSHWIFDGTGMKKGESIPGLVGWEFHGEPWDHKGLEVVAEGDTINSGEVPAHYTATIYPGPKGNFVFNASTIFWAQGLSAPPGHMPPISHHGRPHGPDARVQRITKNILDRAKG